MKKELGSLVTGTLLAGILLLGGAGEAAAQDLVYQPQVPGFGGSAAVMQVNLQLAQAQKPQSSSSFRRDPLQDFEAQVQRSILSQLAREIVGDRFGGQGTGINLQEEGHFDLGNFTVDILPGPEGVDIRVANLVTGNSTVVTVPNF